MKKKKKLSEKKIEEEILGKRPKEFCDPGRECPNCGGIMTREKGVSDSYGVLNPPPKEAFWICKRCDYQEE
jgi:hypothetical protein